MRAIPYNTKSGGYRATIAAYLRDNEATPEDGSTVSIDLGKSGGYTGTIPVMIPVEETSAFEADWVNEDMTRFPARIKAAATALKDLGHSGTFRIEASDDGIVRISGEAKKNQSDPMQLKDSGSSIDATFSILLSGAVLQVFFESRGPNRNTEYQLGLNLLLERLSNIGYSLLEVHLASSKVDGLPMENTLLEVENSPYPIDLSQVSDFNELGHSIAKAQVSVGQEAGAKGGNRTKRIRLGLDGPTRGVVELAENLAKGDSTRGEAISGGSGGEHNWKAIAAEFKGEWRSRLFEFCLEHSYTKTPEGFLKRRQFRFPTRECFGSSVIKFPKSKSYARVHLPLKTGVTKEDGLAVLKEKFDGELSRTDQEGDTMEAIHPYIRTSEQCEDLIDWFSSDPDEQKERRRIIEKRRPLKDYFGGSVTDINREALARAEQPWLRDTLLGGNPTNHCNLCGREFSNDLLVAAHIKRRADCSDTERTDPSIGMLLCRFGCDELYERGYVIVSEGGKVTLNKEPAGEAATAYMSLLEGQSCRAWSESSEAYFAWHRERHETT